MSKHYTLEEVVSHQVMTQTEIMQVCGASQPAVSRWVSGRQSASLDKYVTLARHLRSLGITLLPEGMIDARRAVPHAELAQRLGVCVRTVAQWMALWQLGLPPSLIRELSQVLAERGVDPSVIPRMLPPPLAEVPLIRRRGKYGARPNEIIA
jgi:transcriptional regulator with XRE-family HTH domain